ncbi:MAG: acylneuraminate cytidylyltransferase family protein [Phycisphaeraceae bacterium]|nr:MAG: acylneuraminate cytidylyltransferase family protein [Phycisphaeraceae bacterium]
MPGALALILARAGSKGVPGKNARPIAGRPCIAWTIDHAQHARSVARIVVSTDCPEVARVAKDMGVELHKRPDHLASDTARIDDAARDALRSVDPASAHPHIVILYANVPVRPPGLIDRALDLLADSGADSVQSYQPVGKHHPWWTTRIDADTGAVHPWEGDTLNHAVYRRQDLPPAYIPDGAIIALTRAALMLEIPSAGDGPHAFFGVDRRAIINPEHSVVDIDTEVDLLVAEYTLARTLHGASRP